MNGQDLHFCEIRDEIFHHEEFRVVRRPDMPYVYIELSTVTPECWIALKCKM